LYGTPSIREASAAGLGEVISLTATKFLAGALIIKMTGPLLRIVGDRNPSNVKIPNIITAGGSSSYGTARHLVLIETNVSRCGGHTKRLVRSQGLETHARVVTNFTLVGTRWYLFRTRGTLRPM
jgi:hypothetical protein